MSSACAKGVANYAPALVEMNCLKVGYKYRLVLSFEKADGSGLDISADGFTALFYAPGGTLEETLTVGDGLSIENDGYDLAIPIESPVTATAGKHTLRVIWAITETGEESPVAEGPINVSAVGASCGTPSNCGSSALRIRVGGSVVLRVNRGGGGISSPREQVIEDGDEITIPAGKRFMGIGIAPDSGTRTISVGTTDGGTEIFDTETITSNTKRDLFATEYFPSGGTLYFTLSDPITARVYYW